MSLVAVFTLPLSKLLNDLLATVWAAEVHNFVVVENYFDKATYFVKLGVG